MADSDSDGPPDLVNDSSDCDSDDVPVLPPKAQPMKSIPKNPPASAGGASVVPKKAAINSPVPAKAATNTKVHAIAEKSKTATAATSSSRQPASVSAEGVGSYSYAPDDSDGSDSDGRFTPKRTQLSQMSSSRTPKNSALSNVSLADVIASTQAPVDNANIDDDRDDGMPGLLEDESSDSSLDSSRRPRSFISPIPATNAGGVSKPQTSFAKGFLNNASDRLASKKPPVSPKLSRPNPTEDDDKPVRAVADSDDSNSDGDSSDEDKAKRTAAKKRKPKKKKKKSQSASLAEPALEIKPTIRKQKFRPFSQAEAERLTLPSVIKLQKVTRGRLCRKKLPLKWERKVDFGHWARIVDNTVGLELHPKDFEAWGDIKENLKTIIHNDIEDELATDLDSPAGVDGEDNEDEGDGEGLDNGLRRHHGQVDVASDGVGAATGATISTPVSTTAASPSSTDSGKEIEVDVVGEEWKRKEAQASQRVAQLATTESDGGTAMHSKAIPTAKDQMEESKETSETVIAAALDQVTTGMFYSLPQGEARHEIHLSEDSLRWIHRMAGNRL